MPTTNPLPYAMNPRPGDITPEGWASLPEMEARNIIATARTASDTFKAAVRSALRAEPGLSADGLDEDGLDLAWVTWGPVDDDGYRIAAGINAPGLGVGLDVDYAFISAAFLDGEHSERVICLIHMPARDLAEGQAALIGRLLDALRADRDRPRCPECKGAGSWGSVTCQACGGPGFVGSREEFIDNRPDPYDADEED